MLSTLGLMAPTAFLSGGGEMKEQFRPVFAADVDPADAIAQLDRWIARALRSRLEPFEKAARTMRDRRPLIVNALHHKI